MTSSRRALLCLERDPLWRDWIRALGDRGHDVHVVASVAEATRALGAEPDRPDVVLVGASFPRAVATQLLEHARRVGAAASIVALTYDETAPRPRAASRAIRWVCVSTSPNAASEAIESAARLSRRSAGRKRGMRAVDGERDVTASRGFLVVEDQPIEAAVLRAVLSRHRPVTVAGDVHRALELLRSGAWSGVIVDLGLPDGSGLSVLRAMRERGDTTPALVLTTTMTKDVINTAHRLGADYVVKPPSPANLERFVAHSIASEMLDDTDLTARLAAVARRYGLSRREMEIVGLAARGAERAEVARALRVTENTLKAHIRAILRKTAAPSYAGLARLLLER